MLGNGVDNHRHAHAAAGAGEDVDRTRSAGYGPPRPLDGVVKQLRELIEYANQYVEARKDMMRATVRSLIWKAAAGAVAAIAGVTLVVVAVVYLMSGIAHGLGSLFGERYWLGELVTGAAVVVMVIAAALIGIKMLTRSARERTVKKYERRQQEQRQRFGHSATDRAQQIRETHRS